MRKTLFLLVCLVGAGSTNAMSQNRPFTPVTEAMLLDPDPGDWLMFSRTYDAQRFSPLDQINTTNVGELEEAW